MLKISSKQILDDIRGKLLIVQHSHNTLCTQKGVQAMVIAKQPYPSTTIRDTYTTLYHSGEMSITLRMLWKY